MGHRVKVISPQYVKPFVCGQKNDSNDAQAIAIALMQLTMQFVVPSKSLKILKMALALECVGRLQNFMISLTI